MDTTKKRHASYSQLTSYRNCPQAWLYGYVRKLAKPRDDAPELDFGIWWHAVMAAHYLARGRALGSLREVPEKIQTPGGDLPPEALVEDVFELCAQWWKTLSDTAEELYEERLGEEFEPRLRTVYENWFERWSDEHQYEQPLAVEMGWYRDLPTLAQPPSSNETIDPRTALVGYVDLVYFDTRRNMAVIRDHKTSKTLGTQSVADDMLDSQLQLYAWGGHPRIEAWKFGPVKAISYDRVRSIKPTMPKVTQAGGLSKSVSDYDARTYLEWCATKPEYQGRAKDGSQAGIYEAEDQVLAHLRQPSWISKWFQRTLTPLSTNIVKAHLRSAVDSALDMDLGEQRARLTGSAARNFGGSCRYCDFASLCRAELIGGADGEYPLTEHGLVQR